MLNLGQFATSRQRGRLRHERGWYDRRVDDSPYGSRIVMDPGCGRMLLRLAEAGAELAWATGWNGDANLYVGPLLGLPALPVAPAVHGCKASTVIPWTQGRPWAWLEDYEDELEDAVALTEPGVPCLPVLVDRATGLTQGHVSEVERWLGEL